jgi:hypothetical protein
VYQSWGQWILAGFVTQFATQVLAGKQIQGASSQYALDEATEFRYSAPSNVPD